MTNPESILQFLPFAGLGLFLILIAYFVGISVGRRNAVSEWKGRKGKLETQVDREVHFRQNVQRTLDQIKEENQKYLTLFVNFPEGVKRLGASYDLEHVCSAVIRLAKDLIDAESIALFLYNDEEKTLKLEYAYGLQKEALAGKETVRLGEGRIGLVAETGILMTDENFRQEQGLGRFVPGNNFFDHHPMTFCAPVRLGDRLLGVLFIGRVKNEGEQEKRFAAMVADLAAISLQNSFSMQSVRSEACTDSLTQLYNRRYFSQRLLDEKTRCLNYGKSFSVFLFDIDHFKNYNDVNGHPAGDTLLKQLADLVRSNIRGTDVVARYGGEEFIVLFSDVKGDQAYKLADQLRQRIEGADLPFGEKQPLGRLTVSGGVASFPEDGDDTETIVKSADTALYKAKQAGRNRIRRGTRPGVEILGGGELK